MKNKKYYYVVFNGLNELGVQEMNEHYKHNQELYHVRKFKLNDDVTPRSKRFRMINQFGSESYINNYDVTQCKVDDNGNELPYYGPRFSLQIKHVNHEIYEVNETYTLVK